MTTVVIRITKRRDAYHVEGIHDGQRAGFAIAARDVESLTRDEFERLCLNNLPDCVESKRYDLTAR